MKDILRGSQDIRKTYFKIYPNGNKIRVDEGVFWVQKQRQGHSLHYVVPYQACFAPQIPQFFIKNFSKKGDTVLDPFAGRGTTVFEANQMDRTGIGVDVSPLALSIAKSKLSSVTLEDIKKRLDEIDFSKELTEGYKEFKDIYHKKTYSEILNFQKQLKDTPVDNLIKTIILGRLHGHSPSFFSIWTFNVISLSKKRIVKQSKKRGLKPEYRNTKKSILKKAATVLTDDIKTNPKSEIISVSTDKMSKDIKEPVDLIVTSPPFLNVINYIDDNWLRFWFLGYDREKLRKTLVQTGNIEEYRYFIKQSMKEMYKVLRKGKYCVMEVGDVRNGKVNLDELIVDLADETGFKVERVLINYITAPKISKAFARKKPGEGTKTNRCVIMKKV